MLFLSVALARRKGRVNIGPKRKETKKRKEKEKDAAFS